MVELSANPEKIKLLVVDDDDLVLKVMTRQLENLRFLVTAAINGEAALEKFRQDPYRFELVLTDQDMPGIDGRGLANQLKFLRPDLPVVLITGDPKNGDNALAPAGPFSSVLYKPFSREELQRSIQSALKSPEASVA
ncbi:MAG: response regulator [Desulfarculaceae bacterium]|nr:response regulator [Desulfarculaceae bacterium]MCF8049477.1 response regulator [Desulfarculaceae bacterium]